MNWKWTILAIVSTIASCAFYNAGDKAMAIMCLGVAFVACIGGIVYHALGIYDDDKKP